MANYVRASVYVDQLIHIHTFVNLLTSLDFLDCRYNVWERGYVSGYTSFDQQTINVVESAMQSQPDTNTFVQLATWLSVPGYLDMGFGWRVGDKVYSVRLLQNWDEQNGRRFISFDVEESAFLPGARIAYMPNGIFAHFKQLLVVLIQYIQPIIGAIDYEADLAGDGFNTNSLPASWGSYFSSSVVKQWADQDVQQVLQITDEHLQIDNSGLLIFIHPLTANQEWTERHEQINVLLQHNSPY